MKKLNVLITNIGRRGYLVDYIRDIKDFSCKVYVSDCDNTASGLYSNNDGKYLLPKPVNNEKLYVKKLIGLCKKLKINIVIPVIDPEIYILSKYKEKFTSQGIFVLVSSLDVLEICYNKTQMNTFLGLNGFLYPKTYSDIRTFRKAYNKKEIDFPVIIKPIYGSGSVATFVVDNEKELDALFKDSMIIQEKIVGQEFGVDTLNNFDGQPIRCVVKKKISMRSGETDKALVVKNKKITNTICKLSKKLAHIGNLDCDVMVNKSGVYVIDLNPRFGGGYPATHLSGENYLNLIFKLYLGENISPSFYSYNDGILVVKEIKANAINKTL